jgi:hypothetical protein
LKRSMTLNGSAIAFTSAFEAASAIAGSKRLTGMIALAVTNLARFPTLVSPLRRERTSRGRVLVASRGVFKLEVDFRSGQNRR